MKSETTKAGLVMKASSSTISLSDLSLRLEAGAVIGSYEENRAGTGALVRVLSAEKRHDNDVARRNGGEWSEIQRSRIIVVEDAAWIAVEESDGTAQKVGSLLSGPSVGNIIAGRTSRLSVQRSNCRAENLPQTCEPRPSFCGAGTGLGGGRGRELIRKIAVRGDAAGVFFAPTTEDMMGRAMLTRLKFHNQSRDHGVEVSLFGTA